MIAKQAFISAIIFTLSSFISPNLYAQEADSLQSNISDKKKTVMILSSSNKGLADKYIEEEVTDVIINIANELNRFDIVTASDLWDHEYERAISNADLVNDSMIVNLKELIDCEEAVVVKVVHFSQKSVPPEEDEEEEEDRNFVEKIIDGIFSSGSDYDFSNNIQTQLSIKIENIDVVSGESIHDFDVSVSYTGGDYAESRKDALKELKEATSNKVKFMYQLISEVISVEGTDLYLFLGSNVGVTKNTLFEIIQPDRKKIVYDKEVTIPGNSAGLVCVNSFSREGNQSRIIRQWRPIEPGYHAHEFSKNIFALQLFALPDYPMDYFQIGLQFHFKPLAAYDYGLNLRYNRVSDSYKEKDNGFGFGAFGAKRILTIPSLLTHAKAEFDADFIFKRDEDGNIASTPLLSFTLAIDASLMLTSKSDFELNIGYRFSTKSSSWTYSEEDESYDAIWDDSSPEVDLSGFYFTIGYKFIFL